MRGENGGDPQSSGTLFQDDLLAPRSDSTARSP